MHNKKEIRNLVLSWLNAEWTRLGKNVRLKKPFQKGKVKLISPKGELPFVNNLLKVPCYFLLTFYLVTMQKNGVDCGVFTWRYAYGMYILRDHSFNSHSVSSTITSSPAFQFDLKDIERIRKEMTTLVDNLEQQYVRPVLRS